MTFFFVTFVHYQRNFNFERHGEHPMDDNIRQRAYFFLLAELQGALAPLENQTQQRANTKSHPATMHRLAAIKSIQKHLKNAGSSNTPWTYFDPDPTYDSRRMTKSTLALLKKYGVVAGVESQQDVLVLNALNLIWGRPDLIAAQLRNRHTRQNVRKLLESTATTRWERAAETFLLNQSGRGKIRRCLLYLYFVKLLPGHHKADVQRFCQYLQKRDTVQWNDAPAKIQEVKQRLEQLSATIRQRKKRGGKSHG